MPVDMFAEVCDAVCDMLRGENSEGGRAAVDREMRRLLND
jgi:hypothetical protein